MASWSDLPLDLLGVVLACFSTYPVDRARMGAVCRSWRSAVRHHERRRLPWIVSCGCEDQIYIPFHCDGFPLSLQHFPDGGVCVAGSTDSWLAVGLGTEHEFEHGIKYVYHGYVLHNPFSNTTVPLAVLNDIIVNIGTCRIYKFLMRSSAVDDFIALVTNNMNYPLIVFRQGKGAWVAEPYTSPYIYIIDVAFLGDTLYALTQAEDLIPLNLALDVDGKPVVTIGKRVIRRPPDYDDYDEWSAYDEEEEDDHDVEEEHVEIADDGDNIEEEVELADDDDNIGEEEEVAHDDDTPQEDDGSHYASFSGEFTHDEETGEMIIISRHLIVPRGELLMVRRHKQIPSDNAPVFTRRVDVLEANASTSTWVPLPVGSGLGGGRALFISMCFSKSVSASCGEVEEDVIYDIDTGEVFDIKSQTSRQGRFCKPSQGITHGFSLPKWCSDH